VWNGAPVLTDTAYFRQMTTTSQNLNQSYGYLWWLNGKESFKLPTLQITFPGSLIPEAPADMFMALGKNDQKIYVIPSQNMVVVRFGDTAGGFNPAYSSFDREVWRRIADLEGTTAANAVFDEKEIQITPNPARDFFRLEASSSILEIRLFTATGQPVFHQKQDGATAANIQIAHLPKGIYFVKILTEKGWRAEKILISE
jgi:CubicO group peptidase (beta-lactamase class C family)